MSKALEGRAGKVKLYEMSEVRGTFKLKRQVLDDGELGAHYPRRALSVHEAFEDVEPEQA